jgi:hypothetical protein
MKRALARFRGLNRESRVKLKKQSKRVDRVLREITQRNLATADLTSIVSLALEKRKTEQEQMAPVLERLQQKLQARADTWEAEPLKCLRESVEIASNWLTLHHQLTANLLKLAAERHAAAGEILRARPVKGEIDYAELSREHVARYPKIRARLAE